MISTLGFISLPPKGGYAVYCEIDGASSESAKLPEVSIKTIIVIRKRSFLKYFPVVSFLVFSEAFILPFLL
ncbi:hypothetical protein BMS3Bbin07_01185 [bacterium BMS3Bbin07]|nr:hypothetical protein BMS3Bbin07_01185 [bacterium BMS3Bbin07]